jgi:hypothetical protein
MHLRREASTMPTPPDGQRPERERAAPGRRDELPPWQNPGAKSQWWFAPTRPPRVVDEAPNGDSAADGQPQASARGPVVDATSATRRPQGGAGQAGAGSAGGSPLARALAWLRRAGVSGPSTRRIVLGWGLRVAVVVVAVSVLAVAAQGLGRLGRLAHSGQPGKGAVAATHVPTHVSSPTPTPAQTELDGVITFTNLDPHAPFEGDVHVVARTGGYACRNAPLPPSTWHVQLDPGASLAVPCEIPVSSPPTLAAHTFRQVVTSADGSDLALVDNPAPFTGVVFVPTPGG